MPDTRGRARPHAVILLTLLILPPGALGYVSVFRWATLFGNTVRAFVLFCVQGHSDYAMTNFDAVVNDLTFVLREYMAENHVSENVEKPNIMNEGYLCLGEGNVHDLRSLEKVGTIQYQRLVDRSVMIHIRYRLRVFVVRYGVFYMRMMGLKKRGSIELDFQQNQLLVRVRVAHVSRWWAGHARCIFSVTQFEFTELDDVRVKLQTKGVTHGELTGQAVTKAFRNNNKFLMKAIKTKLLRDMYNKLQSGNRFICTDPELDRVAEEMNALRAVTFTEEYGRRCGKDRPASGAKSRLHFWRRRRGRRDKVDATQVANSGENGNVVTDWDHYSNT